MIKKNNGKDIPTWKRSSITAQMRAKSNDIIAFIFIKCPNCEKYSLKPNYDLDLVKDGTVLELMNIVEKHGRICLCGYENMPFTDPDSEV